MRRLARSHAIEVVLVLLHLLLDPPPVVLEDRLELLVGGQGLRANQSRRVDGVAAMMQQRRDNLIDALARAGRRVGVERAYVVVKSVVRQRNFMVLS